MGIGRVPRMVKAKEALILFLRSLPAGSKFTVMSFGSEIETLEVAGESIITYNEDNSQSAIKQIETFEANLGGTDISTPLTMIITMEDTNLKKRVFCLTDGQVSDPQFVIDLAKNKSIIVHTVGIGDGCDKKMLVNTAKEGRGSCSLIKDDESESFLNGKIISALQKALEPALEHCTLSWELNGGLHLPKTELNTIFRNQLVHEIRILS